MNKTKTFVFWVIHSLVGTALAGPIDPLRLDFKHDGRAPALTGELQPGWDVQHYDLDLWLVPSTRLIDGQTTARVRSREADAGPLLLHANGPVISAVTVEGEAADWSQSGEQVLVDMPAGLAEGAELSVVITYSSTGNREFDDGFNWGSPSFNFNEPQGARKWLVLYDDPADKATLTWRVRAPSDERVVANGVLLGSEDNGDDTTTWTWDFDLPIASYLMVLYLGDLEQLEDDSGRVPVYTWSAPWLAGPSADAFATTPDMIEVFSDLWGDYPWSHYANVVVPFFGGMENTTATTFAEDIMMGDRAEEVNAHELAHHWWGDYVTLAEWPEVWLNEGFASYGEVLWTEAAYGEEAMQDYLAEQRDSYLAWKDYEGTFPMYDPEYLWGGTVYDKGAFVLHMLRLQLGDDAFFAGMRAYGEAHAYANATTPDLQAAMEAASGQDLGWYFDQWVYQAGEPSFRIELEERPVGGGLWQVDLHLFQTADGDWIVPVEVGLTLASGEVVMAEGQVEGGVGLISVCTASELVGEEVDPRVHLLYDSAQIVPNDEPSAPLVCGEALDSGEPADTGEVKPSGACACAGGGAGGLGWLAPLLALSWSRRRRASGETLG